MGQPWSKGRSGGRHLLVAGIMAVSMSSTARSAEILTGYIVITDAATSASLGYVSNGFNAYGEYGPTTTSASRLSVTFDDSTSLFSITSQNNPASALHPELGAIVGFASGSNDLTLGSSDYAYLGGTDLTAPGATPAIGGSTFADAPGIPEPIE